jgi:hypothetical protein
MWQNIRGANVKRSGLIPRNILARTWHTISNKIPSSRHLAAWPVSHRFFLHPAESIQCMCRMRSSPGNAPEVVSMMICDNRSQYWKRVTLTKRKRYFPTMILSEREWMDSTAMQTRGVWKEFGGVEIKVKSTLEIEIGGRTMSGDVEFCLFLLLQAFGFLRYVCYT